MQTYRYRDRQTHIQTYRPTNMLTDKQADKHADICRQTAVQADKDRHRYRQDIDIQSDWKKDRHIYKPYKQTRQTDRQIDKQADKDVDIYRQKWFFMA